MSSLQPSEQPCSSPAPAPDDLRPSDAEAPPAGRLRLEDMPTLSVPPPEPPARLPAAVAHGGPLSQLVTLISSIPPAPALPRRAGPLIAATVRGAGVQEDRLPSLLRDVHVDPPAWSALMAMLCLVGVMFLLPALQQLPAVSQPQADPERAAAALSVGADAQLRRGEYAKAEQLYRQALLRSPAHAAALAGLTRTLLETGRPSQALHAVRQLLKAHPGHAQGLHLSKRVRLALASPQ